MSGFTKSIYITPLYAPLFIVNDTICIFNHYTGQLYHYDTQQKLLDSVPINYHHPKNWKEWKKKIFADEFENKIYALYSKDGRQYLKEIDFRTGIIKNTYKLQNHSAEKIKIREGWAYYIYRPFESTQQKFLYREKIR
jgi:hypothetical protein